MNFDNLNISDFIEAQLPDFIAEEYPKFVNFFQEYYKSLEIPGGTLDISNNFANYLDSSNLSKDNLVSQTTLISGITASGTTISVNSVKGFSESNGIILIDSEIIFYKSVDKVNNKFLNCARGYSAVTEFKDLGTTVKSSTAAAHNNGATVKNLSNLISFAIIKHYQNQYLKGFPYTEVLSDISEITLIENIKEFYQLKGTTLSLDFLFRVIFNETVIVRYPRDWVIKPSTSDWTVDDIIKVEAISGNPLLLIGQQIYQTDLLGTESISTLPEPVVVNNVISYVAGSKQVYELRLNILNFENFKVPPKTILRKALLSSTTNILVDSTIGFPETNGIIQIDNELIFYKTKSYSQFFECTRGYFGTVAATHTVNTEVTTTEYLYSYINGDTKNPVKMRLLGLVAYADIRDGGAYYSESDIVDISPNGVIDTRQQFSGWRINEVGNTASSSVLEYQNKISNVVNEVASVYKGDDYVYVAGAGFPYYSIGPFDGLISNILVGNQYHLKRIPLLPDKATEPQIVGTKGICIFKDGVQGYSSRDEKKETFGDISSVTIINGGFGFTDSIKPNIRIVGGGGSGAVLSATSINGKITEIAVVSGGTNFTSIPTLEIAYGFDATAAVLQDADIVNGSIQKITVTSGGTQYKIAPEVQILDSTGRGKGAYAVAVISGGTVTRVDVLTGGLDYDNKSTITVNLISTGRGTETLANVREWNYDRVFTLQNTFNSANGKWEPSPNVKTDQNNGYLFNGLDNSFGLEFAYPFNPKSLRFLLTDNVKGSIDSYTEVTSNFKHSPILGWAYDGHPIYGPYGYADPASAASNIKRLVSGYKLRDTLLPNRPNSTNYPKGSFIQDYIYVSSLGDLDIHNGRFCVTPEFPNGTYAYFLTVGAAGEPIYPYIVGPTYNSIPASANFINQYRQSEEYLPSDAKRLRTANTPIDGFDIGAEIANVERGSITTFIVKDGDAQYKVGDFVYFDNTNTEGSGAYATVETVTGKSVSGVTVTTSSGSTLSGASFYVGSNQPVYPDTVTAPAGNTIDYDVFVTTISGHSLVTGDAVYVNVDINAALSERTFKVKVATIQVITYNVPSKTTNLAVGLSFNEVLIPVNNVTGFSLDDYIKVNNEIMQIISINSNLNELTVTRGALSTTAALHSSGDVVVLYIPDDAFDYRLNLGQTITVGSATATINKLDKQNKQIELKLAANSAAFTNSTIILDNSLPIPAFVGAYDGRKQLSIASVTPKQLYWEIDATNIGTFFVRNLSGLTLSKGNRYIFDVSDSSNAGYTLAFSEDANNNVGLYNVKRLGIPGNANAKVVVNEANFTLAGITRIYYHELEGLIPNYKTYFDIRNHEYVGLHNIIVVDNFTFKYKVTDQPEPVTLSGISYFTYSQSAIGKINTILNIDGGKDYKKLPQVVGITHKNPDNAEFTFNINNGQFESVFVSRKGSRYSSNTIIKIVSSSGSGAILTPTITNGQITNVVVSSPGANYRTSDTRLVAIDLNNSVIPISDTIGKIKTVRITATGNQLNSDSTLTKSFEFGYNLIISTNSTSFYGSGERLQSSGGALVQLLKSYKVNQTCYFVKVKLLSGLLFKGDTLVGNASGLSSTIEQLKISSIFANVEGYTKRYGYYASDWGKLNSYSQRITDSYLYQDFSYVIRSALSTDYYKTLVYNSTHPAGFKLFGEVGLEADLTAKMSSSAYRITEVNILSNTLNVQSTITEQQYTVSILNSRQLTAVNSPGSAVNDIKNKELDVKLIDDISTQFLNGGYVYNLFSNSDPLKDLGQFDGFIALNEIVQEPTESIPISKVSASGNVLTVTTTNSHHYAHVISGVTYPLNQYITLSGVAPSKLNDTYEIFGVPSGNSFTVLFNNNTNLSGTVYSGSTGIVLKGEFFMQANQVRFVEKPKDGTIFYGMQYRFVDGANTSRYCYKLKNLLFDGVTTEFFVRKAGNDTIITTDPDENLLIFLDGILQDYGTSYTIDRNTTSPSYRKIIFNTAPPPEKKFFGYSFSKYKVFDDISSQFNGATTNFNINFNTEAFKILVPEQLMVVLDGVPQRYGSSYTIQESILTFKEAPAKGKKCRLLFFYGKTFDKKFYIYNTELYANLVQTGVNDEGCPVFNPLPDSYRYIVPGDKIEIEGESPKELISIENNIVENLGVKEYITLIYNDDSFVKGKNGVGTAVLSGIQVASGVVTSGIGGVIINNGGVGYDVAPIIVFKSTCDNPGRGAQAKANVTNGVITSIEMTSFGSGYTKAPEVVVTKAFKIIRNQYPVYSYENTQVSIYPELSTANMLGIVNEIIRTKTIPTLELVNATANILTEFSKILLLNTGLVDDAINPDSVLGDNKISTEAKALKLGVKLINFFENRFSYQPGQSEGFATNNGLTVGQLASYMPTLTLQDVIDRPGSEKGANFSDPSFNFGLDSYVTFGSTLASGITASGDTVYLTTTAGFRGNHNYFRYSEQFEESSWIRTNSAIAVDLTYLTPAGFVESEVIIASQVSGIHGVYQDYDYAVSGVTFTLSVYAREGGFDYMKLTMSGATDYGFTYFDLPTQTPQTTSNQKITITPTVNGWYRYSVTQTAVRDGKIRCRIDVHSADNEGGWTGDNIMGIFVWGAQLEANPQARIYIKSGQNSSSDYNFPIFIGNELIRYTTISGNALLNCTRGPNAYPHSAGDYVRVAWED